MILLYEAPRGVKFIETEAEWCSPGTGERTNGEFVCNGYRVSLGKMRVVWVNGADGSVRLYIKD